MWTTEAENDRINQHENEKLRKNSILIKPKTGGRYDESEMATGHLSFL